MYKKGINMNCRMYEKFSLGQITGTEFKRHVKHCKECQQIIEQDTKIESLVNDIKTVFHPDALWNTIESSLITEKEKNNNNSNVYRMTFKIIRVAAVLIIVLFTGIVVKNYFIPQPPLLSDTSIKQYQHKEKAIIEKIKNLENKVQFSLNEGNIDQQLRYKEYLNTVNSQIKDYQQALDENPANTHIRNYLIRSLNDKKKVLKEFIHVQSNS